MPYINSDLDLTFHAAVKIGHLNAIRITRQTIKKQELFLFNLESTPTPARTRARPTKRIGFRSNTGRSLSPRIHTGLES